MLGGTSQGQGHGPGRHRYQDIHVTGGKSQFGDIHIGDRNALDRLPYVDSARFNHYDHQHDRTCLKGTRVGLLQEICQWVEHGDRCIFWLNGLAGTGKSTIARTLARKYSGTKLGASFFFSRGGGDTGNARKFFPTIARQLCEKIPGLQEVVSNTLQQNKDLATQALGDQWRYLILHPLLELRMSDPSRVLLVIDALDECDDMNDIKAILRLLPAAQKLKGMQLRVFITSRPETPVRYGFGEMSEAAPSAHEAFVLHQIQLETVGRDIYGFFEYYLGIVNREYRLRSNWPDQQVIRQLTDRANGLFIWADTAYRHIYDGKIYAPRRLQALLDQHTASTSPDQHLDQLYTAVLEQSIGQYRTAEERDMFRNALKDVLGSIAILSSQLSIASLSELLRPQMWSLSGILRDVHAILDIPSDETALICLHHPSFRDFLLDESRCSNLDLRADRKRAHWTLADRCIQLLTRTLRHNICEVRELGTLVNEVDDSEIRKSLPLEVQYASLYWVQHAADSNETPPDDGLVHQFLLNHFLHWLEALSWMKRMSEAIDAILRLESISSTGFCPRLQAFVYDMKRFALRNRPVIEAAPLQTYCSALVFAPSSSQVRQRFECLIPLRMKIPPKTDDDWGPLVQMLELSIMGSPAVAYSPDGRTIAAGSCMLIKVWDGATGGVLHTFNSGLRIITHLAFSSYSRNLVSATYDGIVTVWEMSTGEAFVLPLQEDHIETMAIATDGRKLALASPDGKIRVIEADTGQVLRVLNHPDTSILAFTSDGEELVSVSRDLSQAWDTTTGKKRRALSRHSNALKPGALSADGRVLVSYHPGRLHISHLDSNQAAYGLNFPRSPGTVAISPNGRMVALSIPSTIYVLDLNTGQVIQTFEEQAYSFRSMVFSIDSRSLLSGESKGTVRVRDLSWNDVDKTLAASSLESVPPVKWSQLDHSHLESQPGTTTATSVQIGCTQMVYSMRFSRDGRILLSSSGRSTVTIWDTATWTRTSSFEVSQFADCLTISPDGRKLAVLSKQDTLSLWDCEKRTLNWRKRTNPLSYGAPCFSRDGRLLASAQLSATSMPMVLEASTGRLVSDHIMPDTCRLHYEKEFPELFSHRWNSSEIFVEEEWITLRGERILWLPPQYRPLCHAVHGNKIALGYENGHISVWELKLCEEESA